MTVCRSLYGSPRGRIEPSPGLPIGGGIVAGLATWAVGYANFGVELNRTLGPRTILRSLATAWVFTDLATEFMSIAIADTLLPTAPGGWISSIPRYRSIASPREAESGPKRRKIGGTPIMFPASGVERTELTRRRVAVPHPRSAAASYARASPSQYSCSPLPPYRAAVRSSLYRVAQGSTLASHPDTMAMSLAALRTPVRAGAPIRSAGRRVAARATTYTADELEKKSPKKEEGECGHFPLRDRWRGGTLRLVTSGCLYRMGAIHGIWGGRTTRSMVSVVGVIKYGPPQLARGGLHAHSAGCDVAYTLIYALSAPPRPALRRGRGNGRGSRFSFRARIGTLHGAIGYLSRNYGRDRRNCVRWWGIWAPRIRPLPRKSE